MIARAVSVFWILCLTIATASAQDYRREDLRIPFAAAGPRGLEATLIRPSNDVRYPLALISHGAPRDADERGDMSPYRYYRQAVEFARRGFAVLIVMRRGYGDSGGEYAESNGGCGSRDYLGSARASVQDLRAAIDAMRRRSDVTTQGMIAVGQSAGGFASVALSADPPDGLVAVINFAGGRGSMGDNNVCDQDRLIAAFGTFGKTSRIPMLWVYSQNDLYFWPELARKFHGAFQAAGGNAQFIAAPAFGEDGHTLFSTRGTAIWTPMIDAFLQRQNLGLRTPLPPPAIPQIAAPVQLSANGRRGFTDYLAGNPNKAFAVSAKGAYAWRTGLRTPSDARKAALDACKAYGAPCSVYAVNDELASSGAAAGGR